MRLIVFNVLCSMQPGRLLHIFTILYEVEELCNRVGFHNRAKRDGLASQEMLNLTRDYHFTAPSTFCSSAEPSYFAVNGYTSCTDHMYCLAESRESITGATALKRIGRDLQLIKSKERRDHFPVIYFFHYL